VSVTEDEPQPLREVVGPARLAPIGDDPADPALRELFERITDAHGRVSNLYRTLGHAPAMLGAWIDFAWSLRFDATTDRALRELMILRIAQLTSADYEWNAHRRLARTVGVSDDQVDALATWRESQLFSAAERAALAMTEELTSDAEVSDGTWDALAAEFGSHDLVELVLTTAFYSCVSRFLNAARVAPEGVDRG
jgi:4-carboxymuconolactone decarboxylase